MRVVEGKTGDGVRGEGVTGDGVRGGGKGAEGWSVRGAVGVASL